MTRKHYSIDIKAPVEKVFKTMLGLDDIKTYEAWTYVFNPTSSYKGSWDKGARIYFVGTNEDGSIGGMVSEIAEHIPNKYISIKHLGMLKGDKEIQEEPEVEKWSGGLENYSFEEKDGVTSITIEIDIIEEYQDYFDTNYPKALNKLKEVVDNK